MSDLTALGQEAIAAVSKGVADGAPLVKCQLLASGFYEALRNELRSADATSRSALLAVTHQCHRSAAATSALCRRWMNSRGPLICSSRSSLGLEWCSPWQDHDQCSA
jgi:hypothetical protein